MEIYGVIRIVSNGSVLPPIYRGSNQTKCPSKYQEPSSNPNWISSPGCIPDKSYSYSCLARLNMKCSSIFQFLQLWLHLGIWNWIIWSIHRFNSVSCSSIFHIVICNWTNIVWITLKWHILVSEIGTILLPPLWLLVQLHISQSEIKEWQTLHNLHIDKVVIQLELRYLIVAEIINIKYCVFIGKTGPTPIIRIFQSMRVVESHLVWVGQEPEPNWNIGQDANPCCGWYGRQLSTISLIVDSMYQHPFLQTYSYWRLQRGR